MHRLVRVSLPALGVVIGLWSAASAAAPPQGYGGARLGMKLAEVRRLFPAMEQTMDWSLTKGAEPLVVGTALRGERVGPFSGCTIEWRFLREELFRVIIVCPAATPRQLARYLDEQYGAPNLVADAWKWKDVGVSLNLSLKYWTIEDLARLGALRQALANRRDGTQWLLAFAMPGKKTLAAVPAGPAPSALRFQNAQHVAVTGKGTAGKGTFGIRAADFDKDGRVDLVVSGHANGRLWQLKGLGTGAFETVAELAVGPVARGVALGDFNADGLDDVAVATADDDSVWVLLTQSDGRVGPGTAYAAGNRPVAVATGDFNADGKLDMAVANESNHMPEFDKKPGTVSVFLNDGTGKFSAARSVNAERFPTGIAAADVDQDGTLDLVVGNMGSTKISFLRGKGQGTFAAAVNVPFYGRSATDVAVLRLGPDRVQTVVIPENANGTVQLLRYAGKDEFREGTDNAVGRGATGMAVADIDGDGVTDVLTADTGGMTVSVLLGQKDGTFTLAAQPQVFGKPRSVVAADVNQDGKLDVIATNMDGPEISVLINETAAAAPNVRAETSGAAAQ